MIATPTFESAFKRVVVECTTVLITGASQSRQHAVLAVLITGASQSRQHGFSSSTTVLITERLKADNTVKSESDITILSD
ncbi:hypothetical protein Tco_0918746 [Tanacetum coccineum]